MTTRDDRLGLDATVDLAGEGSFPASDPPPWSPTHVGAPNGAHLPHDPLLLHEVVQQLRDHVRLLSEAIGERNDGSPIAAERLARAAAAIEDRLRAVRLPVKRRPAANHSPSNVEAVILGRTRPLENIVVGAHYDSARGSPGADDNASGVAVLLALAESLQLTPLDRTVRLVAFANEGPPHTRAASIGSTQYLEALLAEGPRVTAMISLEELGVPRPTLPWPLRVVRPARADVLHLVGDLRARRLVAIARAAVDRAHAGVATSALNLPLFLPFLLGVRSSDHWAFARRQIPAMMITDAAPLRTPRRLHRPDDGAATLDYDRMGRVAGVVAAVVRELAVPAT